MDSPVASNFCPECGSALTPSDSFCSQCGSAVGGLSSGREGFRRRVEDLTVEGWEVKHDYGDRVVMVDRGIGSAGVHVLLLIFTMGLGNLLYAWYCYTLGADRLELRADGTERYVSGSGSEESSGERAKNAGSVALSFFCALIGLAILGDGASSLPAFFVGFTFLATALFAFPPVRKRLDERESVAKFGRVRSTDEEVITAPDVPCSACARPINTGVKRTFHETFYVAGFPVTTDEKGENCYCRSCARGDPFTDRDIDLGDSAREKERER